jgi:hypothetical protein
VIHTTVARRKGVEGVGEVLTTKHSESPEKTADSNTFNTFNTFSNPAYGSDKKGTTYRAHDTHDACAHVKGTGWEKGVGGVEGVADPKPEPSGFLLNVRNLPGHRTPWDVRLAHLIKHLKRAFGFEVVAVHPATLIEPTPAPDAQPETPWGQGLAQLAHALEDDAAATSDTVQTTRPAEARASQLVLTTTVAQKTDTPPKAFRIPRENLGVWARRPASALARLKEPQPANSPTAGTLPTRAHPFAEQGDPVNVAPYLVKNSQWLRAEDLGNARHTYTITAVDVGEVGEGPSRREQLVLTFAGVEKRLGLNKTNLAVLVDLYGAESDHWIGRQITLRPDRTNDSSGKLVPCVRVDAVVPTASAAPAAQQPASFKERAWKGWLADHPDVPPAARLEAFRADVAAVLNAKSLTTVEELKGLGEKDWQTFIELTAAMNSADSIPF